MTAPLIDPAWDRTVVALLAHMKPRYQTAHTLRGQALLFRHKRKKKVIRGPNAGTWK